MVVLPAALVWAERRSFGLRDLDPRGWWRALREELSGVRAPAPRPRCRARGCRARAARVPDDRTPEDRFGDLGPREPTAAERFAELDEGDMEAERKERERQGAGPPRPGGPLHVGRRGRRAGRGHRGRLQLAPERGPRLSRPGGGRARAGLRRSARRRATPRATRTSSRTRDDEIAGNDTPACDVDLPGRRHRCELFEEKPLVLDARRPGERLRATSSRRCRRSAASGRTLQFAAVDQRALARARRVRSWSGRGSTFPVGCGPRPRRSFNLYRVAYCSTAFVDRGGHAARVPREQPALGRRAELEKDAAVTHRDGLGGRRPRGRVPRAAAALDRARGRLRPHPAGDQGAPARPERPLHGRQGGPPAPGADPVGLPRLLPPGRDRPRRPPHAGRAGRARPDEARLVPQPQPARRRARDRDRRDGRAGDGARRRPGRRRRSACGSPRRASGSAARRPAAVGAADRHRRPRPLGRRAVRRHRRGAGRRSRRRSGCSCAACR